MLKRLSISGKYPRFDRWFNRIGSVFVGIVMLLAGDVLPKKIKEPIPRLWGWMEGKRGRDMTGYWFSSWRGHGDCRIVNSKIAFAGKDMKIVFGVLNRPNVSSAPHLWVTKRASIIDEVCPPTKADCQDRRVFAIVNPTTLALEKQEPITDDEKEMIDWHLKYLDGFKRAVQQS